MALTMAPETVRSLPAMHVVEREGGLLIELEVPGYTSSQLCVEVADHTVTVEGKRAPHMWDLERRFPLPAEVDPDRVHTSLDDGLLTIRAPRAARTGTRRVEITSRFGFGAGAIPL